MTDEPKPQTDEDRLANEIAARRGRKPKAQVEPKHEPKPQMEDAAPIVQAPTVAADPEPTKPAKSSLVRVIMKRNYHPINDFQIDGKEPTPEERVKVFADRVIDMDRAEAKACYERGIVAPYDPFG